MSRKKRPVGISVGVLALVVGSAFALQGVKSASAADVLASQATVAPNTSDIFATALDGNSLSIALWSNYQRVVKQCMADQGQTYVIPATPTRSTSTPILTSSQYTYNVTSTQRNAYKFATSAYDSWALSQKDAFSVALRGSSSGSFDYVAADGMSLSVRGTTPDETGGCEATARQTVTVPAREASEELAPDLAVFADSILASAAWDTAEQAWSNCMRASTGSGYDSLDDVADSYYDLLQRMKAAGPLPPEDWTEVAAMEQAAATASASCQSSSGFNAYITSTVAPQWNAFRTSHKDVLNRAAGAVGIVP